MRKMITKRAKQSVKAVRKATARPMKRAVKKSGNNRKTEILTADGAAPIMADALEELLVAFAHGNHDDMKASLEQLCSKTQVAKLNLKASELLKSFHASIWSLRSGFDTRGLSMTSTSLPEASKNLDKVLVRAGDAAHKVLALVEQQEAIQTQSEQLLMGLEKQLATGALDREVLEQGLTECRALVRQTRQIASEMVYTQDFEDLCGQVIFKVRRLILTLEGEIRSLLGHLKVEVPNSPDKPQQAAQDQSSVDELLKSFGI